jgi:hypothetical protein
MPAGRIAFVILRTSASPQVASRPHLAVAPFPSWLRAGERLPGKDSHLRSSEPSSRTCAGPRPASTNARSGEARTTDGILRGPRFPCTVRWSSPAGRRARRNPTIFGAGRGPAHQRRTLSGGPWMSPAQRENRGIHQPVNAIGLLACIAKRPPRTKQSAIFRSRPGGLRSAHTLSGEPTLPPAG